MADVDIGSPAINRPANLAHGSTIIDLNNAANVSGRITEVRVWFDTLSTTLRVGTFYNIGGNDYKCRDSQVLGTTLQDQETVFEADILVVAGDFIGCYYSDGYIDRSTSAVEGSDAWTGGEHIDPGDEATYNVASPRMFSINGSGPGPYRANDVASGVDVAVRADLAVAVAA